ncbi:MAG: guanylate kinase [bacterium]
MALIKPNIFVIAAPSATGKTTLVEMLLKEMGDKLARAVTATSRQPREGEVHGECYYFYPGEEFDKKIEEGFFLEWANVHGRKYGLPKHELERILVSGKHPLLVLDIQGVEHVREKLDKNLYNKVIDIFVLPPSEEEVVRRMKKRGESTEEEILTRLETMRNEMLCKDKFSYRVMNDDLGRCFEEVKGIFKPYL